MTGIEIKNVSKHFKEVKALDDVSVSFGRNKIYGLLGRNGAGKTTLLNMISNRLYPDRGNVTLDGEPIPDNDAALGKIFMMGEVNLYPDSMKVKEALQWTVRFYPETDLEYAHAVAERFQLPLKKKIKSLSTGYASIFKLVTMLSTNAPFILMDEPVLGLDANHRDLFYRLLVEKYAERPATYIISTHLIEEVANVIEHVVIIKNGRIIRDQSSDELLRSGYMVSGKSSEVDAFIEDKALLGTESLGGLKTAYISGDAGEPVPEHLEKSKLDLQKLFIQLTNE